MFGNLFSKKTSEKSSSESPVAKPVVTIGEFDYEFYADGGSIGVGYYNNCPPVYIYEVYTDGKSKFIVTVSNQRSFHLGFDWIHEQFICHTSESVSNVVFKSNNDSVIAVSILHNSKLHNVESEQESIEIINEFALDTIEEARSLKVAIQEKFKYVKHEPKWKIWHP